MKYMTWREICPIQLNQLADGKAHTRKALKKLPEQAKGFDHGIGQYPNDSMTSYRAGWSLTLMKNAQIIRNAGLGLWEITDLGKRMKQDQIEELLEKTAKDMQTKAASKNKGEGKVKKTKINSGTASSAIGAPTSPILENIRSLISLSKAGLITPEAAMLGIEKAAFA